MSAEEWELIAKALGATNPYAAIVGVFSGPAMEALQKPDVGGSATLMSSGTAGETFSLGKNQDSFTPQWNNATWSHVPLDGSARLRIEAIDRDLMEDDPMGIFEVSSLDIARAVQTGNVLPVRVAEQTNRQILFAMISAAAE